MNDPSFGELEQAILERYKYFDGELVDLKYRRLVRALNGEGRYRTMVNGTRIFAHRVIFFLCHRRWPEDVVDHIDGNPTNNHIENLREATKQQNWVNTKRPKHNTSGIKGVCWVEHFQRWRGAVKHKDRVYAKMCHTKEEAAEFVRKKRIEIHGEFARHE
jgi:hypothetical protein